MGLFVFIAFIWLIALTVSFRDFKKDTTARLKTLYSKIYQDCGIMAENKPAEYKDVIIESDLSGHKADVENYEIKPPKTNFDEFDFKTKVEGETKDIENIFFGNLFNKIGAVVLIIACGIFLKFVSQYIDFSPIFRIIAALLSGVGIIIGACYLFKNNKIQNYAAALMGAGFGILFITLYCAFALYKMLNLHTASLVAILLLFLAYFIAKKYKSISTFIIGLIGAYLSPVIIGSNSLISINYLFLYLIFVNIISIIYVSKDTEKTPLNYANIIATASFVHIWSIQSGKPSIVLPFILWALYLLFDMLLIKLMPKNKTFICWINFVSMSSFLISNYFENEKFLVSLGTLLIGLVYSLCARLIKKYSTDCALQYNNGALFALYSAMWFIPSHILKMFSFAIFGTAIAFLSKEKEYLQNWGFGFILSSFLLVFSSGGLFSDNIKEYLNYRYILNERTLFYLVPAFSAICVSKCHKKFPSSLADILYFFGISFCYLFVATEINILMLKLQNAHVKNMDFNYIRNISYVILGFVYSLQLRYLNRISSIEFLTQLGYGTYVISAIALFILSFFIPNSLYSPIINIRTFAIISAILISIFYEYKEKVEYFGYFAIALGFLLINLECYKILEMHNAADLGIIFTSLWMIYAGALIISGIFFNINICKMSGLFIVIIGLLKIFIFDMANVEAIYKIVAFFITGIILMITSYYYTKKKS